MMAKKKLVVLTGAGVSAESGLKTFRDSDGLWMGHKVEDVATPGAFIRNPALVLDFYNQRRREVALAKPNAAHIGFAELELYFDVIIVTQNIDDLHERGGSAQVMHLHGEIFKMFSIGEPGVIMEIRDDILPGHKGPDGTQLRPQVVWFEEPVPMIEKALSVVTQADLFVVAGTSLQVYPAASLLHYVPEDAEIFIVDKIIPVLPGNKHMHFIELPATQGIAVLKEKLLRMI